MVLTDNYAIKSNVLIIYRFTLYGTDGETGTQTMEGIVRRACHRGESWSVDAEREIRP